MKCVGFQRLIDYLDGRLSDDDGRRVAEHLGAGCKSCESDRTWYSLLKSMKGVAEPAEPPLWVSRRAVRLFEMRPRPESIPKRLANAVARLVFDSFQQPMMAGARSSAADSRHLLYSVDDYSIDLQIAPTGSSGADLIGQVLSTSEPGFDSVAGLTIDLAREGETVSSTVTDDIGIFIISKIGLGEYDLQIGARDMTINVVGLPVAPMG
jgi:hypothetical protein